MSSHFRYSRWDGTQKGFELDADDLMGEVTDDLLYHGDLNAALRRLMQQGFEDRDGDRVQGIRDMLERLREARRERLEQHDLGGAYEDIAERLREVIDQDAEAIDAFEQEARDSGDARRQELTEEVAQQRRDDLAGLPPDLAGQVKALQEHDFTSDEARDRFDALMEELRQEMVSSWFGGMSEAMSNPDPEEMARVKDMLAALNEMLAQRASGQEPDFAAFMDRFGDMFPEDPSTLDELLEVMARRMAAMQSMLASMSPEQRAQLQSLSDSLMEDLDLKWQMDQLGANLRQLFPDAGWGRRYEFEGADPLGFAEAAGIMDELGDLDQLEQLLTRASQPGALADVDLERARQLLGDDAARSMEKMSELVDMLTEAGLIEQREGRLELTPHGLRRIGRNALRDIFRRLDPDQLGRHQTESTGSGHERADETKAYEFGDPFNLHIERTIRNALTRQGGGTPVGLTPDDFEVERTEHTVRASTVLMIDLSLSMPMRDNFLPAKKVAMALHHLISTQYPRDFLGLVGFSEVARPIVAHELPEVSWDFVYGTNMQHGFMLARKMLAGRGGTKQIIMVTDGEPTAHLNAAGAPVFHYPPVQETIDATLTEVLRATREGIRINTFMLDATPYLQRFIEQLTELNRGRAFFTTPETLCDYVLVDFIEQRREMTRRRAS
ncbi:VWA domain-containing protein [soil metagenome]